VIDVVLALADFLIPLGIIAAFTLVLTVLGGRSPSSMLASCAMVITSLIWADVLEIGYMVIVTLMLGVALWMVMFRGDED
jgi:hypothetical protein